MGFRAGTRTIRQPAGPGREIAVKVAAQATGRGVAIFLFR
jgi:hypothetical protein